MATSDEPDLFDSVSYGPLGSTRPDLALRLRSRYLKTFFERAGLEASRMDDAAKLLDIDEGQAATGAKALRIRFRLTGSTTEIEWDGSDEEAISFVDSEARLKAGDWIADRERMGPSDWDAPGA